ncbi:MAG: DHHA1 domain-containing protein, partial [bacterium]|nr:DHHA1 domain-containing protein [bacterium]
PNINLAQRVCDQALVYDLVITLDVAAIDSVRDSKIFFDKAKCTVNIDHHKTNPGFGDYQIINPDASSCGEVLYEYFKDNDWQITQEAADCLYVAIMTDTGNFRFENTTSNVFKIVSDLVDLGANPTILYKNCYETKTKNFVMFQNYCVDKAVFSEDNKIAYTTVYKKDLEKFSAGDDYTDGIAETLRAIDTTEVSFVVKEVDSKTTKVSMRSKHFDVSKVCAIYNGGGHTYAAGCTMKYGINESIEKLLKEIKF